MSKYSFVSTELYGIPVMFEDKYIKNTKPSKKYLKEISKEFLYDKRKFTNNSKN